MHAHGPHPGALPNAHPTLNFLHAHVVHHGADHDAPQTCRALRAHGARHDVFLMPARFSLPCTSLSRTLHRPACTVPHCNTCTATHFTVMLCLNMHFMPCLVMHRHDVRCTDSLLSTGVPQSLAPPRSALSCIGQGMNRQALHCHPTSVSIRRKASRG